MKKICYINKIPPKRMIKKPEKHTVKIIDATVGKYADRIFILIKPEDLEFPIIKKLKKRKWWQW